MSKFLNRFYFFSKFSTSLILLIILVFLVYLFAKAYLGNINVKNSNNESENLLNQIINLSNIVEQNSVKIDVVNKFIRII